MSKPIAVLISDVHYSIPTLELANKAMQQAITTANDLKVPLLVAGDLHDTKANMRAECVNAMVNIFKSCNYPPRVLVGNHDKLNERADEHALKFLEEYCQIIDSVQYDAKLGIYLAPYHSESQKLLEKIITLPTKSIIIMHQGISGANMGEYIQDKSAIMPDNVAGLRAISGHYHARQTIKLPNGLWDYIGNPYSLSFGEANDPDKGYQILYADGSLKFMPTNLRKHVIVNYDVPRGILTPSKVISEGDLVWVKAKGPSDKLFKPSFKDAISKLLKISSFRLDLENTDKVDAPLLDKDYKSLKKDHLDFIIDSLTDTDESRKIRLKALWRMLT